MTRLLLVPFTVQIPAAERDKNLMDKLRPEWPAILRWAMDGCLEWQRIGLAPPAVVTKATDEYFTGQDRLTPWLEDECDTEPGNKNKNAPIADLYASWSKYCQDNGEDPGSKKDLGDESGKPWVRTRPGRSRQDKVALRHPAAAALHALLRLRARADALSVSSVCRQ